MMRTARFFASSAKKLKKDLDMHRNMRIILCMARIAIGKNPDKEPTNLSLSKKIKAAATDYCKDNNISLSEFVDTLLGRKVGAPSQKGNKPPADAQPAAPTPGKP